MDTVYQLEKMVEGWYKSVPHLPKGGRDWLADNVWWIALLGVILGVIGLFTLVPAALISLGITSTLAGFSSLTYTTSYYWLFALLSLLSLLVTTMLMALAASPLKAKSRVGWKLLFLNLVVTTVLSIISSVLSLTLMYGTSGGVFPFISNVLGAAISFLVGGYFLFEIRDRFVAKVKKTTKKKPANATK